MLLSLISLLPEASAKVPPSKKPPLRHASPRVPPSELVPAVPVRSIPLSQAQLSPPARAKTLHQFDVPPAGNVDPGLGIHEHLPPPPDSEFASTSTTSSPPPPKYKSASPIPL